MPYSEQDILRRLDSPKPEDRRVGVIMIGKGRVYPLFGYLVDAMKHDQAEDVRAMAAWGLDLMSNAEAVPDLIDALYDEAFSVRSHAGWALVHLAQRFMPEMVVPDVIDVLKDDGKAHAQQMAYFILKRINNDAARIAIRRYWR